MRDIIIAVVTAVVVSVGVSYWLVDRKSTEYEGALAGQKEHAARLAEALASARSAPVDITMQVWPLGGGEKCTSSTELRKRVWGAGRVQWHVHKILGAKERCFAHGETVQIRPKPGNSSPLTPAEPYHHSLIQAGVANAGTTYHYQVWLADSAGNPLYMMEDPELEIIETLNILPK
jgi:hypothetical protein